jgi:hypothetical protein
LALASSAVSTSSTLTLGNPSSAMRFPWVQSVRGPPMGGKPGTARLALPGSVGAGE